MDRSDIIARLQSAAGPLRELGVVHAALFGSRARGDHGPASDIDIMLDFDPEVRMTIYDYVGVQDYVAGLFTGRVDVVDRRGLKPRIAADAEAAAVYAF